MHNGDIGGFESMRRTLLRGLSDKAFAAIRGSTDSEHVFALLLDQLEARKYSEATPAALTEILADSMQAAIAEVEILRKRTHNERPALLNLVVSDGQRAVVARYASDDAVTNSLYYNAGSLYSCEEGLCRMSAQKTAPESVLIASEPLDDSQDWTAIEAGHLLMVDVNLEIMTRAIF